MARNIAIKVARAENDLFWKDQEDDDEEEE